eukprot:2754893-Amphidinium_carterae.2
MALKNQVRAAAVDVEMMRSSRKSRLRVTIRPQVRRRTRSELARKTRMPTTSPTLLALLDTRLRCSFLNRYSVGDDGKTAEQHSLR